MLLSIMKATSVQIYGDDKSPTHDLIYTNSTFNN